jgi:hypothetical protein
VQSSGVYVTNPADAEDRYIVAFYDCKLGDAYIAPTGTTPPAAFM